MALTVGNAESEISDLLDAVAIKLQLDDTRYQRAETAYGAVGKWLELGAPARGVLDVYSQGSMRLQTTVKPKGRVEYDLDIVATVIGFGIRDPGQLYKWGLDRLREDAYYSTILEPMNRCVRLNYANAFHLDVLFAIPDPSPRTDATSILVPDRKLRDWSRSNPKGYAVEFERQCEISQLITKRAFVKMQAPLPSNDPAQVKAALKRVVQLLKRIRDIRFDGADGAPRSIVITELAARHYLGETNLYEALVSIMTRIAYAIEQAHAAGDRLRVHNPTNVLEEFSESWGEKPEEYEIFVKWVHETLSGLRALPGLKFRDLNEALDDLFGERVVREARMAVAERVREAVRAGEIRNIGRRLATGTAGSVIPSKTFFGTDDGGA